MKLPAKTFFLLIVTALVFTGCGKEVINVDRNFVGIWNGSDGKNACRLSIDNAGSGYWHKNNANTAQGMARIKGDKLYIGIKSFNIERYPCRDSSGTWTLTLSGIIYKR